MEKQKTGNRRLIAIGGSIGATLPKTFLKKKGWSAGDRVSLIFDDIAVIIRLPREPISQSDRAGEDSNGSVRTD